MVVFLLLKIKVHLYLKSYCTAYTQLFSLSYKNQVIAQIFEQQYSNVKHLLALTVASSLDMPPKAFFKNDSFS